MLNLTKISETASKITLGWTPVAGAIGYRFQSSTQAPKWSHTWDATKNQVTFSKAAWYKVEALGVEEAGQYPNVPAPGSPAPDGNQAPPMPQKASSFSGPITITQGGTYSGNWRSTSTSPAVSIVTQQPVIIQDSQVENLAGGRLIYSVGGGNTNVTLRRVVGWGGSHRFFEIEGHMNLLIENCSFSNTGGIRVNTDSPGAVTVIRRNYHLNPRNTPEGYGNFVQLNGARNGTVLIEWNQVVGQHNKCDCEDSISVIAAKNVKILHNMLWHNSLPNNAQGTNGSITFETSTDCEFAYNYITDSTACPYVQSDVHRVIGHHNRCIQDGYLHPPFQNTQIWSVGGWALLENSTGSHFHDNVWGWTGNGGAREELHLIRSPGTPHTPAQEIAMNTILPSPITRAMEEEEWVRWQADLVANNITIGA